MPCDSCDRLRAQLREAREELAEWRRSDGSSLNGDVWRIKRAFGINPQPAIIINALMRDAGRVVTNDALVEAMGYAGEGREPVKGQADDRLALQVVICKARSALRAEGLHEAISNVHHTGYIMPRTKAAEITKIIEAYR